MSEFTPKQRKEISFIIKLLKGFIKYDISSKIELVVKLSCNLIKIVAPLVIVCGLIRIGYIFPSISGFADKQVWDWLEILIIPLVLGFAAYFLNESSKKREIQIAKEDREKERSIEKERHQNTILQNYIDKITELFLSIDTTSEWEQILIVCRTRTVLAIKELDNARINLVFQFLREISRNKTETRLLDFTGVNFNHVDFTGVDLSNIILNKADLSFTKMIGTKFINTWIDNANFAFSHIENIDIVNTKISNTSFTKCSLIKVNFNESTLENVSIMFSTMKKISFQKTNLVKCRLICNDLKRINFGNAKITDSKVDKTKIHDSNFKSVELHNSLIQGSELINVNLCGTSFYEVDLTNTLLMKYHIDEKTKGLPEELLVNTKTFVKMKAKLPEDNGAKAFMNETIEMVSVIIDKVGEDFDNTTD